MNWYNIRVKVFRFFQWLFTKVLIPQLANSVWELVQVADANTDLTSGAERFEFVYTLAKKRFPSIAESILRNAIENAVGKLKNGQ